MLLANAKLGSQQRKGGSGRNRTWHLIEPGNDPQEIRSGSGGQILQVRFGYPAVARLAGS